jgi:outer membrane lipoprotein-sorting protein
MPSQGKAKQHTGKIRYKSKQGTDSPPKFGVQITRHMKKLFASLFVASLAIVANAQTADDVIAKYAEAMGGMEKIKSVTSVYTEGISVAPNGTEITSRTYRVQDKLYRQEIDFGMGSITFIVTDKEGWFSNPRNGGAFEAIPADRLKNQQHELDCISPLFDYAAKGHKVELVGKETIDGVEAYNLKLTTRAGNVINYFIDNKNWYVIRTTTKGAGGMFGGGGPGGGNRPQADVEMKTDYSNYQKTTNGYLYPMTVKRPGMGGATVETTIEKVEFNKTVDPKLFKPE